MLGQLRHPIMLTGWQSSCWAQWTMESRCTAGCVEARLMQTGPSEPAALRVKHRGLE